MTQVLVREVNIEEVVEINNSIAEFHYGRGKEYFEKKYQGKTHLIILGYIDDQPAGYIVAYDKFQNGSLYCWMAAVKKNFRKRGVLSSLMEYMYSWAREHGFERIRIKTRNKRREMLSYLVKNGFNFYEVSPRPDILENRIFLEKELSS